MPYAVGYEQDILLIAAIGRASAAADGELAASHNRAALSMQHVDTATSPRLSVLHRLSTPLRGVLTYRLHIDLKPLRLP